MIVKCLYNKSRNLPRDFKLISNDAEWDYSLKINKNYIVYAMTLWSNHIWYYICDEHYSYFPVWKPSPFFEVVNGSMSKYWIYSYIQDEEMNCINTTWAYPEWADDPDNYYDKLSDCCDNEVKIFNFYKQLMDLEFSDPSINDYAKVVDDEWLFCDTCIDAWKSNVVDQGMLICPKCKRVMHNPRYQH